MNLRRIAATFSPAAWLIMGAVALLTVFMIWLVITSPGRARQETASARAGAAVAGGNAKAAGDAVEVVTAGAARDSETDAQTRNNDHDIKTAPGASDPVDAGVDCAGRRAVCLRNSARDLPACQQLRRACP